MWVIIPKFKYSSLAEVENDELSDLEQMEGNDSNDQPRYINKICIKYASYGILHREGFCCV